MQKTEELISEPQVSRAPMRIATFIAFLVLIAATLILPVWIVQYPPLLDYPNHLARSFILTHLNDPTYHFSQYYTPQWGAYPYLMMDFLFLAFQQVFPVTIAGKLVLSICLLGLPLAVWWFVRQACPDNQWIATWALILTCNEFFLESFLAFQLSLIACFVMMGFWLRWANRITVKRWFALLTLTLLIYFSHLIGFILAGFAITVFTISAHRRIKLLLISWLLFVPGCMLYLTSGLSTHNGTYLHFRTAQDKFDQITHILFGGYSSTLTKATAWIALACLTLGWIRNRNFRWNWHWVAVAILALSLYVALPYSYGETFDIDVRVLPVLFVILFVVADFGPRRSKIIGAIALLLFAARIVTIAQTFRAEQPELQAISRGVAQMQPNSLMLTIVQPRHEHDPNRWPYEHFYAWAVIERGAFSPYLFDLPGQTPMRITYQSYTPDAFWDSEYQDDDVDWDKVREDYDYVWLYNVDSYTRNLDQIGSRISQYGAFYLYRIRRKPRLSNSGQTQD